MLTICQDQELMLLWHWHSQLSLIKAPLKLMPLPSCSFPSFCKIAAALSVVARVTLSGLYKYCHYTFQPRLVLLPRPLCPDFRQFLGTTKYFNKNVRAASSISFRQRIQQMKLIPVRSAWRFSVFIRSYQEEYFNNLNEMSVKSLISISLIALWGPWRGLGNHSHKTFKRVSSSWPGQASCWWPCSQPSNN